LPNPPPNEFGFFTHTIRTKANSIKFAHQLMCSPKTLTLLKAIRRGFLDGCPNLTAKGVTRYLNQSPATAKGHMKRPHQGIRSTSIKQPRLPPSGRKNTTVQAAPIADKEIWIDDISDPSFHAGPIDQGPSVIVEDNDSSLGNNFCFAAFADKRTGVLYNDLTGSFPYMSLEGNVCYLITYHYKSNAILGLPISGFDDKTVFAAYKTQFELLESKGYKIKLYVMDNQCTKQINKFLTQNDCELMLVEPHNIA
jgi:hypothetical protein